MSQISRNVRDLVCRFVRESKASVAINFGITLIPILLGVGAVVDYSRANSFKAQLQQAIDASILVGAREGAKEGSSNWKQVAANLFSGELQTTKFGSVSASPSFKQDTPDQFTGSVSGDVPTTILELMNLSTLKVSVTATAKAAGADDSCILTLDHGQPTSHISLSLNGAPIVNLSGCSIRSNTAIDCNGHDGQSTKSIAAGVAADCAQPRSYAPVVPDIYPTLATNITTVCGTSRPGVTWIAGSLASGPGVITVSKTGYTEYHICGDLTVSGSGYLTGESPSSDSVIIIENGRLTVPNGAAISTSRTAIVMTGDNSYPSTIDFPNGNGQSASLSLSAPTNASNPWQGVALYQDPKLTYQVDNHWGPGATFNADGLVYLGKSNVVTSGNTGSSNSKCSKFVMNSFITNGSVNLNLNQQVNACSALGLKEWGGIIVHLIK